MDKDLKKFCRENKIELRRFLVDYCEIYVEIDSRYRLKHEEFQGITSLYKVSEYFMKKHKDLVVTGNILIVEDEFHRYQTYVNPNLVKNLQANNELYIKMLHSEQLNDLNSELERIRKI